eukprot:881492-Karenia_brevis.AAC.1
MKKCGSKMLSLMKWIDRNRICKLSSLTRQLQDKGLQKHSQKDINAFKSNWKLVEQHWQMRPGSQPRISRVYGIQFATWTGSNFTLAKTRAPR